MCIMIVHDYKIVKKGDVYSISTTTKPVCEQCNGKLGVRGSKCRYMIAYSGERLCFKLRQLYCRDCCKMYMEFPDIMIPYKHYSAEAIQKAVSGKNTNCCAENSTIQRWKMELKYKNK